MNQQIRTATARVPQTFRGGLIDAQLALTSLEKAWKKKSGSVFTEAYRRYNGLKCIKDRHVWRRILADYRESEAGRWTSVPTYVASEYANLFMLKVV